MLSASDNEMLTRCGPGTPMGNLMRQYWIPAILASELPGPDCPPLRIRVLNENLIAFRATSGKVGLVDDTCPHRGASMFFGRNEEEGLRCVYHGWKFDTTGQCTDMMNEPAESNFKNKVRITAYPTNERGGIIWAYMGPREVPPPLPEFEANMVAPEGTRVNATLNDYNWLQALENNMDTAHNAILHHGSVYPEHADELGKTYFEGPDSLRYMVRDRAPHFMVQEADFGCTYGAYRSTDDGRTYWRTMNWLWPFYTMSPTPQLGSTASLAATVPVDDYHNMQLGMTITVGLGQTTAGRGKDPYTGAGMHPALPNTSDWLGRFRNSVTAEALSDFGLDRELQKQGPPNVKGFTGLLDINTQDEAMRWSQGRADRGGIVDRSKERLGTTDAMIIRVRRKLVDATKALLQDETTPPAVDTPSAYRVRAGWIVLPKDADWWEASKEPREGFKNQLVTEASPS